MTEKWQTKDEEELTDDGGQQIGSIRA